MRFPPKLVSVLCSMQTLFIVLSWAIVGGFRKAYTIATSDWLHPPIFFQVGKLFFYGAPLLLLVPLVWGYVATTRADVEYGGAMISEKQGWIGWALTAAVLLFCSFMILTTLAWVFTMFEPL